MADNTALLELQLSLWAPAIAIGYCGVKNVPTGRIGEADRVSEGLDDEDVGTRTPQRGRVTRCRSLEGNEV